MSSAFDLGAPAPQGNRFHAKAVRSLAAALIAFSAVASANQGWGGQPGAPTLVGATAGDGQVTVSFTAPISPDAPVTSYTATCNPGAVTATGADSPITVTGLTNGTAYTCAVTATNVYGTGPASADSSSVTPKAPQTIAFADPGAQDFGTSPVVAATASSGLAVTFTSATTGICTVTSGGALTFVAAGTCTLDADQAGNAAFLAAPRVSRSFMVNAVVPGAPTLGTATAGDGRAILSFTPPATTGGAAITSYAATCNPGAIAASAPTSPITITGLANGTAYACSVAATNSAGTGSASGTLAVTPATTSYSAMSGTGSGIVSASFAGGGANCTFVVHRFIRATGDPASPPASGAPASVTFPDGLFDFTTGSCAPGSTITMTVTWPTVLPPGTRYYKYGPTPATPSPHWYVLPATVSGNTTTFTITDGGLGDDDLTANGAIVDQGGPGVPGAPVAATPVPTLSQWASILLSLLVLAAGARSMRRSR